MLIVALLLLALSIALHALAKKLLQARSPNEIPAFMRTRPGTLELVAILSILFTVGAIQHAAPPRWPEWLRDIVALTAFAAIYWGGKWILRLFGGRGPS